MIDKKVTFKYLLIVLVTVLLTWIIHEFAHWLMSKLLGYETTMRINGTFYIDGEYPTDIQKIYVSASGPIIKILQGFFAYIYLKNRGWNKYFYPILFIAFYMRFLAGLMNFINLNDEGRISKFLGIGTYTLSIIVSGFLFYLVFKISKKYQLNSKFQILTALFVIAVSSILILSDMYFGIRII